MRSRSSSLDALLSNTKSPSCCQSPRPTPGVLQGGLHTATSGGGVALETCPGKQGRYEHIPVAALTSISPCTGPRGAARPRDKDENEYFGPDNQASSPGRADFGTPRRSSTAPCKDTLWEWARATKTWRYGRARVGQHHITHEGELWPTRILKRELCPWHLSRGCARRGTWSGIGVLQRLQAPNGRSHQRRLGALFN